MIPWVCHNRYIRRSTPLNKKYLIYTKNNTKSSETFDGTKVHLSSNGYRELAKLKLRKRIITDSD